MLSTSAFRGSRPLIRRSLIQQFSTKTTALPAAPSSSSSRFRRFAQWARYGRIGVLVVSVYSLGYQQGVVDCVKSPLAMQEKILLTILMGVGVKDLEQVETIHERDVSFFSTKRNQQVASVGQQLVETARVYVVEQLEKEIAEAMAQLPPDMPRNDAFQVVEGFEPVSYWNEARYRLSGEDADQRWTYHIIQSRTPNAFVSEILPRRFFITTAMLELATNSDELAVVLGHEVSHLILGHVSATNRMEMVLRTIEVLLLSIDPTEGFLALGVVGGLAWFHRAIAAAYSRDNEREADALGVILAARAGFDTPEGVEIMKKMHDQSIAAGTAVPGELVQIMDSHPPTLERYEWLKKESEIENARKYGRTSRTTKLSRRFWNSNDRS